MYSMLDHSLLFLVECDGFPINSGTTARKHVTEMALMDIYMARSTVPVARATLSRLI